MKHLLIFLITILAFSAAHAQLGYFAFIDHTRKILYITEMTDMKSEKSSRENGSVSYWERVNYEEGFIQQLGFTEEERKKHAYSSELEFVGNIEEFKKFAYNKRERRISIQKEKGFKIEIIPVPVPKPLKYKTSKSSAQ